MAFIDKYARRLGVTENLGTWDAQNNVPFLESGKGKRNTYYVVSVDGTTDLDGFNNWVKDDWAYFDGKSWRKVDNTDPIINQPISDPVGVIKEFAGTVPPNGWFFCDGEAVSRVTYSALFAVIGVKYGCGDGSTTFNLPNLNNPYSNHCQTDDSNTEPPVTITFNLPDFKGSLVLGKGSLSTFKSAINSIIKY